jgi:transketolase
VPALVGGSADLAGSNQTTIQGGGDVQRAAYGGRNLAFGVREHAMGAILNGIALSGGHRVFGGTFLQFADYMRPSIRLAALMAVPATYVFTHDSIGLGEDGPTHQPIEHLAALRAIPHLAVARPADANETAAVWAEVLRRYEGPVAIALTRQDVPVFDREGEGLGAASLTGRGAYVLAEAEGGAPQVLLIGTGSEVQLALGARAQLQAEGIPTRVVSMPCQEWFAQEPDEYQESVLPDSVTARVSVEAGVTMGWSAYLGPYGVSVGIDDTFGASASAKVLFERLGITVEAVVAAAHESLRRATAR